MKKRNKYLLGIFGTLAVAAAVAFTLDALQLIQLPSSLSLKFAGREGDDTSTGIAKREKVARKELPKNASFQELISLGDTETFRGNFGDAIQAFQKSSELEPQSIIPYEKIAEVSFLKKDYVTALKNFEFASNLQPENASLKLKIVRGLLGLRNIVDAKLKLEQITPETQQTLYYRGLIAAFLNDQGAAQDFLTKSLTAGTDETIKTFAQKILTIYREFELERDGRIEHIQTNLALAFDQVGESGLAIELAFDALKTKHDYRDTWIVLGHAFLNELKWFDAEDALAKAIDLDASHPSSYFFRGVARQKLNKHGEAIKDFEEALKLGWQPKILAKQAMADSYFELQDFAKAFPLYKEVVTTDSADLNRFIRPIALAINHLNLLKEAEALAKKALETHPDASMAFNLVGWAALANNDLAAARQNLETALKRDPELDAAYLNLGQLTEKAGNLQEALSYYEKAIELAEKNGNPSIGNTAKERYNAVQESKAQGAGNVGAPKSAPAAEKIIPPLPSLSLE